LVKPQDLPTAVTINPDDPSGISAQKRAHASGLSAAQKAELMDEDSEEEDFEKMPLMLKDLKSRAHQALTKKRRRNIGFRSGDTARTEDLATPSRGPSRVATHTPGRATSPQSDTSPMAARRSSAMLGGEGGEVSPFSDGAEDNEDFGQDEEEEGAVGTPEEEQGASKVAEGGEGDARGGRRGTPPSNGPGELPQLCRMRRAIQARLAEQLDAGEIQDVSEEELGLLFLKRYNMNREELELVASRMGMHLNSLCLIKQEFDLFDEDRSGCIGAGEFRDLLHKLGEEPSNEELGAALNRLDHDQTGEVEFFEFCAWFTADD